MLLYFSECAHAATHVNATMSVWFYCVNNIPSDLCSRLYGSPVAKRPHSSWVLIWVVKSRTSLEKSIGLKWSFLPFPQPAFFSWDPEPTKLEQIPIEHFFPQSAVPWKESFAISAYISVKSCNTFNISYGPQTCTVHTTCFLILLVISMSYMGCDMLPLDNVLQD